MNEMMSQSLPKEYKKSRVVFVLDNDECLGAWSLASAIHGLFSDYIPKNTGIPLSDCMRIFKDNLVKHYLPNGGARPGTKDTLKLIKFYKDSGMIDNVLMFTSATNLNDWVICLKECLEQYAEVDGLYDIVLHRDNTDTVLTHDGATAKCMNMVREKLDFKEGYTKIVMVDDRPQNIRGDSERIAVSAYRHVVDEKNLSEMIDEAIDTLQQIYKPGVNKKTYAPAMLRNSLKNIIIVDKNGRKKEIRDNLLIHMVPVNQMNDTSLIKNMTRALIDHIPIFPMKRAKSEHIQPITLVRSMSM
jgi:hypothetical protein